MKKKLFAGFLVAAGAAGYYLLKKLEENSKDEDVTYLKIEDDDYSFDVEELSKTFKYLSKKFINKTLNLKDEFDSKYPFGSLVMIKHFVSFANGEESNNFISEMEEDGYTITTLDQENKDLEISKKLYSQDDNLLSDILNVANIVNALNGTIYTGYEIEKIED